MRKFAIAPGVRCDLAIVALAFLLRVFITSIALRSHAPLWFFAQASELGCLAESLRTGHGLSSPFGGATGPSAFLAPGYPALIALVFRILGSFTQASEIAIMLLQVSFGTLTVFAIMRIAQTLFGQRVAILAGTAAACSPPLLFVPTIFWETSFSICFCASLLALAVCGELADKSQRWLWIGLFTLLGAAVNPSLLTLAVPLWGWAWTQSSSQRKKFSLLAGVACALMMTLWPIRNFCAMHAFIPTRTNMGYELWQGNRPGSTGFFSAQLHPNTNAAEFHRYAILGELDYVQEKSELAKQSITAHPTRFAVLTAKRFACFWTGFGMTTSAIALAYTLAGSIFGLTGLIRLIRRSPRLAWLFGLPLALFPLPYYITHPDLRFRLVLDPVLLILAAYAVTSSREGGNEIGIHKDTPVSST